MNPATLNHEFVKEILGDEYEGFYKKYVDFKSKRVIETMEKVFKKQKLTNEQRELYFKSKDERIQKMIEMRESGTALQKIAESFGVSRQRVHQLMTGYSTYENPRIRQFIFSRDKFTCQNPDGCKNGETKLVLHHKDRNSKNNNVENLTTLCFKCHASVHSLMNERKKYTCKNCHQEFDYTGINTTNLKCRECSKIIKEENKLKWSLNYSKCIICNKSDVKHQSKGKCERCYSKERLKNPESRLKFKKAQKKYYLKNKEKLNNYNRINSRRYYYANREKCLARAKEYALKNPDKIREYTRKSNLKKKLRKLCLQNKPENNS